MHFSKASSAAPVNIRRKIFEFIVNQQARRGCLPSRADLLRLFGDMTEDVDLHLEHLAREGLILIDKDGHNGLSLVPTYTAPQKIGVLGKAAQNFTQMRTDASGGSIALDLRGVGVPMEAGMSAVQIFDDRMIDAGIDYGDIALLVHTTPMRGDIVAIEEAEVMVLRRYLIVSGIPHFLAENPVNPDLRPGWDTTMHGVLWGLIRVNSRSSSSRTLSAKRKVAYSHTNTQDSMGGSQSGRSGLECGKNPLPRSKSDSRKGKSKAVGDRVTTKIVLPKPPSDVKLNERRENFRLTEHSEAYDTWGSRQPRKKAVDKAQIRPRARL